MAIEDFRDLKVWQEGIQLAVKAYTFTADLPKTEQFGLISQMRRSAASVPANIAEGHRRQHDNELR